jgi:hypothetical protein
VSANSYRDGIFGGNQASDDGDDKMNEEELNTAKEAAARDEMMAKMEVAMEEEEQLRELRPKTRKGARRRTS